jgi:hypothetical protein
MAMALRYLVSSAVTVNDLLDERAVLDIECRDRII